MTDTTKPLPIRKNMSAPGAARKGGMPEEDIPDTRPPRPDVVPGLHQAKPAVKFTVHAMLDDFPFDVEFSGSADQLRATVDRLRELGAHPPTLAARQAAEEEQQREAPICQYHGPMKPSPRVPGTWFCPKRMGNGEYCKEHA